MANSTNARYGRSTSQSAEHIKFECNFIHIHMIHCLQYWRVHLPSPKSFQKQYCDANSGGLAPPCTDSRSSAFFPTCLKGPSCTSFSLIGAGVLGLFGHRHGPGPHLPVPLYRGTDFLHCSASCRPSMIWHRPIHYWTTVI